ncbi:MAG: hypothetical protein OHK0039_18780 [Bacteroidia bacterium]
MQRYTWFFSLPTPLDAAQAATLQQDFDRFAAQWKSHGTPVEGMIGIRYGQFIVARAQPDSERPSGCSIDSLRRGIEQILQRHGLAWAEAAIVFYRDAGGAVQHADFRQIPTLVAAGTLTGDTIVFDHTLGQSDDLSQWELPLKQTWLKRYLPAIPV